MTSCFIGAATGSAAAALVYERWGWGGSCLLGAIVSTAAVARWATDRDRPAAVQAPLCEAPPPA